MVLPQGSATRSAKHPIGAVENALRLLVLLRDRSWISVSEASEELGVSRSTAHRLLSTLLAYGLVQQDPGTRAYRGGPMLIELARSAANPEDLVTILHPFVDRVQAALDETTHLIMLEGRNCRFVDSVECKQSLRTTARIGVAYPAHVVSGGKVLLAELSPEQLRELFPEPRLSPLNDRGLRTREELFAELEQIREQGYATSFGQSEMGINAVAMAVRSGVGTAVGAIAVSAPEQRLPASRVPELVHELRNATRDIQRRLP
jgi:DNA-binding IclR family transcriptional regulator